MMENNHIQINHLTIGYKEKGNRKVVATDINACLHSGELTCLLGANGIGKSTLLRTLSGFQAPLEGEIILRGKPLSTYSDKELATLIGVVLTEKCELRNMTVEELVGMGRSPYTGFWGRLGKHDREVIEESIQLVGIGHLRYQMVHQLSDGERQKVMIAKALAQQTDIIFLDEPTAFLDFPSKVEIMQLLFRLSHTGNRTIFLSTHDLELALQIADKVWLMNKENGVKTGTPEDLSLDGSLSHFFLRKGIRFDKATGSIGPTGTSRSPTRLSSSILLPDRPYRQPPSKNCCKPYISYWTPCPTRRQAMCPSSSISIRVSSVRLSKARQCFRHKPRRAGKKRAASASGRPFHSSRASVIFAITTCASGEQPQSRASSCKNCLFITTCLL